MQVFMLTAYQLAQTRDEEGFPCLTGNLETCHSRLECLILGVPPLILLEFEAIREQLRPPIRQGPYGLDLNNYLWELM